MATQDRKFAVLIDAENISDKYINTILDEVASEGLATYRRIYGDFTNVKSNGWKKVLLDNSVSPVQQYTYTTGKNASDSMMIIDAMDILYSGNVDGFCICTSDSDFTRLASRLRESGMWVIGMGEQKTPMAFVKSCNSFRYLDLISKSKQQNGNGTKGKTAEQPETETEAEVSSKMTLKKLEKAIAAIITERDDDDGWAFIGDIGNLLSKRYPDFDPRNYGYAKLTPLIESLPSFEVKRVPTGNPNIRHTFAKIKKKK